MSQPETTAPAAPLLFDRASCGRCGGSGRFSFNQLHGDVCYGCGGSGIVIAKHHREMHAEWVAARDAIRKPTAEQLEPGDEIAHEGEWWTFLELRVDRDRPCAWKGADRTPYGWHAELIVSRGLTTKAIPTVTNVYHRRRMLRAALDARLSPATRAHVQARRAAAAGQS